MTDDFYNVVEFAHGVSLNELVKALDIQDSAFVDAISSLYQTYGFNIEYQRKDGSYVAEANKEFAPTRERMEILLSLAERLFGVWLECAMHMGANKSFETALDTNVNSIYFINGLFYSSSEILIMLYDALRKGTKSGARVRATIPKKDYNIVTYMNSGERKSSMYGISKTNRDIDLKVSMAFDFGSLK
jgi:phosphatidylserine/phosphatidylglycerophosphate/cardiolipin synthase-like enzyme